MNKIIKKSLLKNNASINCILWNSKRLTLKRWNRRLEEKSMIFNRDRQIESDGERKRGGEGVKASPKSRRVLRLAGKYPKFKSSLPRRRRRRHRWISSGRWRENSKRQGEKREGEGGLGGNNLPEIRLVAFGDWIHSYLSPRQSVDSERSTPSPRFLLALHLLSSNPFNPDPHQPHSSSLSLSLFRSLLAKRETAKPHGNFKHRWFVGVL